MAVDEWKDIVRRQMAAIDQQRTEIAQLKSELAGLVAWAGGDGDGDALGVLQSIYRNANTSDSTRVKAASSALGFERPKLSVTAVAPTRSLFAILEEARLKGRRVEQQPARVIEHQPVEPDDAA